MGKVEHVLVIIGVIIADIAGDVPGCDYFDTVDLTNSTKLQDGSYQYGNILIPKHKIGQYNYAKLWKSEEKAVAEHTRGCICQLKSCVRFCCDPQKLLVHDEDKCHEELNNFNMILNVTLDNGVQVEVNALEEFILQQHFEVPCRNHFHLDAENKAEESWTLYENGILYRHYDKKSFGKMDYCLQPHKLENGVYKIVPHQCNLPQEMTFIYIQGVSGIFMILTIALLLYLPELRFTHYKCCTLYLTCLTLSFFLLRIENIPLLRPLTESRKSCSAIAYIGYYAVMSSFLWLLIINYNLWKQFRSSGVKKVSFMKGNIFVWTVAGVLLLITTLIDYLIEYVDMDTSLSSIWKPNFCVYSCWIDTDNWSAMIYYHGPLLILLLFNITFFTKTARRIYVESRKICKMWKEAETRLKIQSRANFSIFFQFFIIAGLIWILEILAYLMPRTFELAWIDCLTSSQGIILFVATILKKEVRKSVYFRLTGRRKLQCHDKEKTKFTQT